MQLIEEVQNVSNISSKQTGSKPAGSAIRFNVYTFQEYEELKDKQLGDAQAIADSVNLNELVLKDTDPGMINPSVYYFHPDHLGSSTVITDGAGYAYQIFLNLPFGETMAEQRRTGMLDNMYKFNGKELDTETGLYYYGARYYDPRISLFISVDPLAEQTMTPYQYTYQNPVRYVDPDGKAPLDIIFLNKNGSINKVVKDGKAHITIIDDGKKMSLSSYNIDRGLIYWNNRNRKVIANISAYYGKKIGVSGIGATYEKSGIAHYDPSDKGIWISPQDNGRTHSLLNNKSNLQNVLVHENSHKKDHSNGIKTTFTSHANVYINQMAHDSFKDTTMDFQEGIIGSFLNYAHSARLEKGTAHGKKLIDEFNDTNQGGWKAGYNHRSGYGWPVERNGETIYFDTKELKNAN